MTEDTYSFISHITDSPNNQPVYMHSSTDTQGKRRTPSPTSYCCITLLLLVSVTAPLHYELRCNKSQVQLIPKVTSDLTFRKEAPSDSERNKAPAGKHLEEEPPPPQPERDTSLMHRPYDAFRSTLVTVAMAAGTATERDEQRGERCGVRLEGSPQIVCSLHAPPLRRQASE